jgi:hypothetical protein
VLPTVHQRHALAGITGSYPHVPGELLAVAKYSFQAAESMLLFSVQARVYGTIGLRL